LRFIVIQRNPDHFSKKKTGPVDYTASNIDQDLEPAVNHPLEIKRHSLEIHIRNARIFHSFRPVGLSSELPVETLREFGIAHAIKPWHGRGDVSAQTLNCHSCGAAVSKDAPNCLHCGARLASISCPTCFAMMFQGAKFCPHCGGPAAQWSSGKSDCLCPACEVPMLRGTLREIPLHECAKCFGLWLDTPTFERICRDAEHQAAVLGSALVIDGQAALTPVRYRRCPHCRDFMNRMNFARCSGVIVDICRAHGTWFDLNELHRIVHFIRAGGLDRARRNEKAEFAEERRRMLAARADSRLSEPVSFSHASETDLLSMVVGAASDLLITWLNH
jgi:Zn-finger nucleic acid-binding protein